MRERGCYSTTTLAQPRKPCRPRHPYAVPRILFQCVCTRRRNCIGQLSPFWEYAPAARHINPNASLPQGSVTASVERAKAAREGLAIRQIKDRPEAVSFLGGNRPVLAGLIPLAALVRAS